MHDKIRNLPVHYFSHKSQVPGLESQAAVYSFPDNHTTMIRLEEAEAEAEAEAKAGKEEKISTWI